MIDLVGNLSSLDKTAGKGEAMLQPIRVAKLYRIIDRCIYLYMEQVLKQYGICYCYGLKGSPPIKTIRSDILQSRERINLTIT